MPQAGSTTPGPVATTWWAEYWQLLLRERSNAMRERGVVPSRDVLGHEAVAEAGLGVAEPGAQE